MPTAYPFRGNTFPRTIEVIVPLAFGDGRGCGFIDPGCVIQERIGREFRPFQILPALGRLLYFLFPRERPGHLVIIELAPSVRAINPRSDRSPSTASAVSILVAMSDKAID